MRDHDLSLYPILIAVPYEWQSEIKAFLEGKALSVSIASTYEEALEIIKTESLRGLITNTDWGMTSEDGKTTGLIQVIKGKIPSVTLIEKTDNHRWFDEVFYPPLHEYCTVPVDLDGLLAFMRRTEMIS